MHNHWVEMTRENIYWNNTETELGWIQQIEFIAHA